MRKRPGTRKGKKMGQAFHRKRMLTSRGRTSGTGVKYVDAVPPVVRELTAEQIAAREAETQQQAALDEQRRLRQQEIDTLVDIFAADMLDEWKEAADYLDQRLIGFAGWTASDYCALPADPIE